VGNPSGQSAYGLHLLGLLELGFKFFMFGNIAEYLQLAYASVRQRHWSVYQVIGSFIFEGIPFPAHGLPGPHILILTPWTNFIPVVEVFVTFPPFVVSEVLYKHMVHILDVILLIDDIDAIFNRFENIAQVVPFKPQRFLCSLAPNSIFI